VSLNLFIVSSTVLSSFTVSVFFVVRLCLWVGRCTIFLVCVGRFISVLRFSDWPVPSSVFMLLFWVVVRQRRLPQKT
jgi:hypothetical protein